MMHAIQKTVVFLHGFPGNHEGLVSLALSLTGYRVLTPDLPGCGTSAPFATTHSLEQYADWLRDFLRTERVERPIIVGHSFGGRVAIVFAVRYPELLDSLILLMPVIRVDGLLTTIGLRLARLLLDRLRARVVRGRTYQYLLSHLLIVSGTEADRRALYASNMREVAHLTTRTFIEVSDDVSTRDLTGLAQKIKVPTLVVAGGSDQIATAPSIKAFADGLADGTWRLIPGTGHVLPIEEPKLVAKLIADWLRRMYHIQT